MGVTRPAAIRVRIERLVLDGVDGVDGRPSGDAVARAIESALAESLMYAAPPAVAAGPVRLARADAPVARPAADGPHALGEAVAAAIHRALDQ